MARRRTPEETGRLGDAIYQRQIREQVEATHFGEIVSIDVESGEYALGDSVIAATDRLRKRCPDADIWSLRIGYGVLRQFGSGFLRRSG
ncbi:MAG: hypothetical protein OXD50_03000 [Chloroflexi bacterium]|nr:hypothetical protein [Chloroflexota bacterium]